MRNKGLVSLFLLFLMFFMVSCIETTDLTDMEKVLEAKEAITLNQEVTANFVLPTSGEHDVSISWTSNNSAIVIVGNNAIVTRGSSNVNVTLTATLTLNDATEEVDFIVTVMATEALSTITVEFSVTIPAYTPLDHDIYIAGDFGATSGMPAWSPDNILGKATRVSASLATFTLVYTDVTEPITIQYKWTRGNWDTVEKAADGSELDNRTVTITLESATFEIDDEVVKWADMEDPSNFTDEDKVDAAKNALSIGLTDITEDFTLPLTGLHGTTVSWESDDEAIEIDGAAATITRGEADVTVILTATITLNDATDTKTFEVVVKAEGAEEYSTITVNFTVILPENTPLDDDIVIAGDFGAASSMPAWNPESELGIATRTSATEATFTLVYEDLTAPVTIQYKWTRGDWGNVEKDLENQDIANRSVTITLFNETVNITDTIGSWADLPVGLSDEDKVALALEALTLAGEVTDDFTLPLTGLHGTTITWESDDDAIEIDGEDAIITRGETDVTVTLTATITLNDSSDTKTFDITVIAEGTEEFTTIEVVFTITVPSNTPMDEDIYIAGSFGTGSGIPAWTPNSEAGKATRISETEATFTITYEDVTAPFSIEYKWTRGSWDNVEKAADNSELANRVVNITLFSETFEVNDVVLKWADLPLPSVLTDQEKLDAAKLALTLEETTFAADFNVPTTGLHDVAITWESADEAIVTFEGGVATVIRPEDTTDFIITATLSIGELFETKEFLITVLGEEPTEDEAAVMAAAEGLNLSGLSNLTSNLSLPNEGLNDTVISWSSSLPDSIEITVDPITFEVTGVVTRLDDAVSGIVLTATIQKGDASTTKNFTASVRAAAFTVQVTWMITIPEAIPNAVVITTGSSNNGWNPANLDYGVAVKINDTLYSFTREFNSPNGTNINLEYKWTLQVPGAGFAAWSGEELNLEGNPVANRTLTITRHTSEIEVEVVRWRIPVGGGPQSTVVGNLDIVSMTDVRLPSAYQTRNVRIWTPAGYDPEDTATTYPVIYMADGQNIFDSATSFAGEWGVDETITAFMNVGGFGGAIVVAIDNTADRLAEYTMNYPWLQASRRGDLYMDFLIEIVKAYVDEHYNTKPEREHTILAGSSMGGLITFFGGIDRIEHFGVIIPFSTSTQRVSNGATNIPAWLETVDEELLADTLFFLYVGNASDGAVGWPDAYKGYLMDAGVPDENVQVYIGNGFGHNEYAWRTHFPVAIMWAFDLSGDKSGLEDLIDESDFEEADYSPNSWNVFSVALAEAVVVVEDEEATLVDVVAAYAKLSSAIDQLVALTDMAVAKLVDDMIVLLPTVAAFDVEHVDDYLAAQAAFDDLTENQKKIVKFYYVLDLLGAKYETMDLEE